MKQTTTEQTLLIEIEKVREELLNVGLHKGPLDPITIKISQQLDLLIVSYQQYRLENSYA